MKNSERNRISFFLVTLLCLGIIGFMATRLVHARHALRAEVGATISCKVSNAGLRHEVSALNAERSEMARYINSIPRAQVICEAKLAVLGLM